MNKFQMRVTPNLSCTLMFESLFDLKNMLTLRVIQQAPEDQMTVSPQQNISFMSQEQPDGANFKLLQPD